MCVNIREKFVHYSLGNVPLLPALKILMDTINSAVQLLVGLTVIEGRALFVSHSVPRIKPFLD